MKAFDFIKRFMSKIKEDNVFALSAQFSYYIILGIFPLLILAISFLSNYNSEITYILSLLENIIPSDVFNIIGSVIDNSVSNYSNTNFSYSILILLWSATAGSATIIKGINKAYGFTANKNYFFMRIEGIAFTLGIMLGMYLIFALIVLGRQIVLFLQSIKLLPEVTYVFIHVYRYMLPVLILFLLFSAAYKFMTYEKVNFSFVFPGAVVSTLGFIIGSVIYSSYISTKIKYYNSIYGNLSGLIVFLIWIYMLSFIFLAGAEVNYFTGSKNKKTED